MTLPGFWHGALVALGLSLAGAASFTALLPLVGPGLGSRLLIAGLAAAYLTLLLRRARSGRLGAAVAWLAVTGLLFALDAGLWTWLLTQVGLGWLVRCLVCHDRLWVALADAALNGLALAAALATALHTRSVWLTLWSFFLVQALYTLLPRRSTRPAGSAAAEDGFESAYRNAEAALRRLATKL